MMRAVLVAAAIWLAGGGSAWAQASRSAFTSTVGGVVGGGPTWDDEGQIGTGALLGFRIDRRLFRNTFAEISLDDLWHERTGRFVAEGNTILLGGAIVQRFGQAAAQPYVLGGIAFARHSGTFGFPDLNIRSRTSSTTFGAVMGGGLAVRAGRRLEIGPETRFLLLTSNNDSAPAFASWVGVRVAARF